MKHTPAPWFITEGPTYGQTTTLKVDSHKTAENVNGMVICERQTSTIRELSALHDQIRANMVLIAAAPDLLAACDELLEGMIPGEKHNTANVTLYAIGMIREAIRKATTL